MKENRVRDEKQVLIVSNYFRLKQIKKKTICLAPDYPNILICR